MSCFQSSGVVGDYAGWTARGAVKIGLSDFAWLGCNSCEFFEVFIIGRLNEWLR